MSKLRDRIKEGLAGKFQGLANGFKRLNTYIFGIQRGVYILLGGQSGTFKTTLVDFMALNAMEDAEAKKIKLHLFYYSYEIEEYSKKMNWLSVLIYKKYGIIIPPEKIKGLGDNRLNIKEQELVDSEIDYIDNLFTKINFRFKPTNPTGIYNELWKHFESIGKFEYEPYIDKNGNKKQKIVRYIHNDPNSYTLVILDHLLLLLKERGFSDKEVIDKMSEYMVELRNLFGCSAIFISQFNDGLSTVDRAKFKGIDLSPQMTDFKSTRNPYADACVVLGTMCPYKLDMDLCLGYDIKKLKSNMLMLKILKNRLSSDSVSIGLYVNPKAGSFEELPKAKEMTTKDYEKYINK
jgi:hypothetical protein